MKLIRIDINKKYWEWILDGHIIMRGNFIDYTRNDTHFIIIDESREIQFPLNQIVIEYIKE